jgi:uncharacterized protein (DUF2062 family)
MTYEESTVYTSFLLLNRRLRYAVDFFVRRMLRVQAPNHAINAGLARVRTSHLIPGLRL